MSFLPTQGMVEVALYNGQPRGHANNQSGENHSVMGLFWVALISLTGLVRAQDGTQDESIYVSIY